MGKRVMVVPEKEGEENKSGSRWIIRGTTCHILRVDREEAQDRVKWRHLNHDHRPHVKVGNDADEEEELTCSCLLVRIYNETI